MLALFEILIQLGLIALFLFAAPFLLFVLTTIQADRLERRGEHRAAYRGTRAVHYFTELPLARLWFGRFRYLQLRALAARAEKLGDGAAARDWLRDAADARSAPSQRVLALTELAALLRRQGRNEDARNAEAEALTLSPGPGVSMRYKKPEDEAAATYIAQAELLTSEGHFAEALALLEKTSAVANWHKTRKGHGRIAALRHLGRYAEAIAIQEEMGRELQEKTQALLESGRGVPNGIGTLPMIQMLRTEHLLSSVALRLEAGDTAGAAEHWAKLLEMTDDGADGVRQATGAWVSAREGRRDVADAHIALADAAPVRIGDAGQRIDLLLARAESTLGEYARAAARLETLISAAAHTPLAQAEYRALLADCYAKTGRVQDARAEYERVIAAGFEEALFTRDARDALSRLTADPADTGAD